MEEGSLSFYQLKALANKAKQAANERYKEASRKRLDKIMSTKIRTAFIGAIAAFEEGFGFLWGQNKNDDEITEAEEQMYTLWEQVRTKILNNGNNQLRAASSEIANHIVSWNRYHTEFIPMGETGNE